MLILFDIDDTLLDHGTSMRLAAAALHGRSGSPLSVEEFCARWAAALERHFARYMAGEVSLQGQRRDRVREVLETPDFTDEAADEILERYTADYEASWCLFPDALACLDRLSGFRLGIVSNGPGDHQRLKLERMGVAERFEHVVISEEVGTAKPDPGIFLHACSLFGVDPSEALHVGDRYDLDVLGARAAGLRGVWLDRKGAAGDGHEAPRIETLDELPLLVQGVVSVVPVSSGARPV